MGAKLSDNDVEKLLAGLEITQFASQDKQEVSGYAQTMETIFAHWQDMGLQPDRYTGRRLSQHSLS